MKLVIGFSRSKDWYKLFSTAIQQAEKRNYSHVYIKHICPITKESIISQASHGLVNDMNESVFLEESVIVEEYEIRLTSDEYLNIMKFIKRNLGKKYSYKQIFLISLKKLFRIQRNENNKDQEFICSELGARIVELATETRIANQDYVTPSDLNKLINTIDRFKRIK